MTDTEPTPDTATHIRTHLATIRDTWHDTATPMQHGHGTTTSKRLPASTIVLRADTTLTLAFWVHALVDEHPIVMQVIQQVPVPTTDPGHTGWTVHTTTATIDCTDVHAMCDLLDREADRIAGWGDYGPTFAAELEPLATAARFVSKPPRRDRMAVGECPDCARTITAKATPWRRLPIPTTDPDRLAPWTEYQPTRDQPITCKGCGRRETLTGWRAAIVGAQRMLTADELVEQIHAELGMRYSPVTIRVWARRGLIRPRGRTPDGRTLYDRVQVFAALMEREARRGA